MNGCIRYLPTAASTPYILCPTMHHSPVSDETMEGSTPNSGFWVVFVIGFCAYFGYKAPSFHI